MNIQEMKEEKKKLEKEIERLIKEFEDKTGVLVANIDFSENTLLSIKGQWEHIIDVKVRVEL